MRKGRELEEKEVEVDRERHDLRHDYIGSTEKEKNM